MYIGSCIDDKTDIACFAVFVRQKTARSRADDGVFRESLMHLYVTGAQAGPVEVELDLGVGAQ